MLRTHFELSEQMKIICYIIKVGNWSAFVYDSKDMVSLHHLKCVHNLLWKCSCSQNCIRYKYIAQTKMSVFAGKHI